MKNIIQYLPIMAFSTPIVELRVPKHARQNTRGKGPSNHKQKKLKAIEMRQEASLVTQNQITQITAPAGYALVDHISNELPHVPKDTIGTIVFRELEDAWWILNQTLRVKHAVKQSFKAISKLPTELADSVSMGNNENEKDNLYTHDQLRDCKTPKK